MLTKQHKSILQLRCPLHEKEVDHIIAFSLNAKIKDIHFYFKCGDYYDIETNRHFISYKTSRTFRTFSAPVDRETVSKYREDLSFLIKHVEKESTGEIDIYLSDQREINLNPSLDWGLQHAELYQNRVKALKIKYPTQSKLLEWVCSVGSDKYYPKL